jgi:hypothetical protein
VGHCVSLVLGCAANATDWPMKTVGCTTSSACLLVSTTCIGSLGGFASVVVADMSVCLDPPPPKPGLHWVYAFHQHVRLTPFDSRCAAAVPGCLRRLPLTGS